MESLESKLDRLSPEQRMEIEDFVDFLLSRSGKVFSLRDAFHNPPTELNTAPPPISLTEPVQNIEIRPAGQQDLPLAVEQTAPANGDEPAAAPFHEIGVGAQDRITHDYMDYGQFELQSSPATEAVKKVKRKLIAREGEEQSRHLLDWVD
jgi:hypothetical protein